MNGNALKLRRAIQKHNMLGVNTAPFIYYIEDIGPYGDLLGPVFGLLESHALRGVTSTITIAQILTKPFTDKKFSLAEEIEFTLRSFSSVSVIPVDETVAEAAALIRTRYAIRLPTPFRALRRYRVKRLHF